MPNTFFLKITSWGWGTWKRAWSCFNEDGAELLKLIKTSNSDYSLNIDGLYDFTKMLEDQMVGRNDSWAIRWQASVFLHDGLTLYSAKSLARNIGLDNSGTHCNETSNYICVLSEEEIDVNKIPCVEDMAARKLLTRYFCSLRPHTLIKFIMRILNMLRR